MPATRPLPRTDAAREAGARTYVYGVVRRADARPVRQEGIGGAEVLAIEHQGVAALASEIPGTGEIRARRRDLLRHSDVLQDAIATGPVVPLRFGSVLASTSSVVRDFLAPRHDELLGLLEAFDGLVELSIRAFYREENVLAEIVHEDARVRGLREAANAQGATRRIHIELGEAVAAALERKRAGHAEAVLGALRSLAREVSVQERTSELEVIRASALVHARDVDRVDRAMDELAQRLAGSVLFKYLGPLPPHSFVSLHVGEG
jgi:Gas vesicle synthesis protein GvpL/GvpF